MVPKNGLSLLITNSKIILILEDQSRQGVQDVFEQDFQQHYIRELPRWGDFDITCQEL